MYQLLKKLIAFALIPILPVYLLAQYDNLDRTSAEDMNVIKLSQTNKFDSLDILFIGSSFCYSGVYPEYFDSVGLKTYNLGIGAAGPYFYDLILNDYIKSVKSPPKSIFIQIAPNTFSSVSDNFLAYPIHRYLNTPVSNEKMAVSCGYLKEYFEMEIKSLSKGVLNLINHNQKANSKMIEKINSHKGFFESYAIFNSVNEKNEESIYMPLRHDNFDEKKFSRLLELAREFKKAGINVIFFEIPTYKLSSFFNKEFLNNYDKNLKILNQEFIFFKNDLLLTPNQYRNIDHINTQGANIFTPYLASKIFNNKSLDSLFSGRSN